MIESLTAVIDYILCHEAEDFAENPDRDHIYFHAVTLQRGEITAENEYQQALADLLGVK